MKPELSPEDIAAIDAAVAQEDIPLDGELLAALQAWCEVPSYVERHQRAITMYIRLKAGETLYVQTGNTHKRFSIRPEYWGSHVLGYSVVENGEVVPGYHGKMLEPDTMKDWLSELVEVAQQ